MGTGEKLLPGFHEGLVCFHSINVPSEWGRSNLEEKDRAGHEVVSIQLMSPASGDSPTSEKVKATLLTVSIQLMSPASGDFISKYYKPEEVMFPFN